MKFLSKSRWVNITAFALAALGVVYVGKNYAMPEILGRIGNRPNIVLISIDTLRADHFTPELLPETWEWVDDNCTRFTNAHSNSTWTLPGHLTMLTGLLPHEHGVESSVSLIPDDLEMVQRKLQKSGYKTVAFTSGGFVGSEFGFSRGFSKWHENNGEELGSLTAALEYFSSMSRSRLAKPKFIFLHTFYVHHYDRGTEGKYGEFHPDKYKERVRELDGKLVGILDAVMKSPLSDNLRMIVTSDHGEGLGEVYSGLYGRDFVSEYHGDWPSPSQERIPLFVYDSRDIGGKLSDKLVGLDDFTATLEVWAGIADAEKRYLFDKDERDFLLSEAFPLGGTDRLKRRLNDLNKRGVAKIGRTGEYIEASASNPGEKSIRPPGRELSDKKKKELEALGYMVP